MTDRDPIDLPYSADDAPATPPGWWFALLAVAAIGAVVCVSVLTGVR